MNESERVLVLAPAGRDAELTRRVLGDEGIEAATCASMDELCAGIGRGAGAAVLTEEGCAAAGVNALVDQLGDQEPWSDLPLVVLTSNRLSTHEQIEALRRLGSGRSVTFLERPVRRMTLVSTLRSALQARRRQYELRDVIERLARDLDNRDEFLALLGHELRNPLGAIRSCLEVLRLGGAGASDDSRFALTTLDRQLHHVTRLIDDLLDISRVTRGRLRIRPQPMDLCAVISQAVESVRPLFAERDVQLVLDESDGPLPIEGDEVRLLQAVSNVLSNAARYTPAGGRVDVGASANGEAVELRVCDTGAGLEPEMLERVFDAFVRVDRKEEGLGVGLTLARRIAEMHGGRLWAESEGQDRGSEFVLTLPRLRGPLPAAPDERGSNIAGEELPSRRIMIVEDHPDQARSLGLVLSSMGHEVRIANAGLPALELAGEFEPELVLLDLDLPDLDGCEVARRLRADPRLHPMLVAVSGYGLELDRLRTRRAGCVEHLTKPVTPAQLRRVLGLVPSR